MAVGGASMSLTDVYYKEINEIDKREEKIRFDVVKHLFGVVKLIKERSRRNPESHFAYMAETTWALYTVSEVVEHLKLFTQAVKSAGGIATEVENINQTLENLLPVHESHKNYARMSKFTEYQFRSSRERAYVLLTSIEKDLILMVTTCRALLMRQMVILDLEYGEGSFLSKELDDCADSEVTLNTALGQFFTTVLQIQQGIDRSVVASVGSRERLLTLKQQYFNFYESLKAHFAYAGEYWKSLFQKRDNKSEVTRLINKVQVLLKEAEVTLSHELGPKAASVEEKASQTEQVPRAPKQDGDAQKRSFLDQIRTQFFELQKIAYRLQMQVYQLQDQVVQLEEQVPPVQEVVPQLEEVPQIEEGAHQLQEQLPQVQEQVIQAQEHAQAQEKAVQVPEPASHVQEEVLQAQEGVSQLQEQLAEVPEQVIQAQEHARSQEKAVQVQEEVPPAPKNATLNEKQAEELLSLITQALDLLLQLQVKNMEI